MVNTISVTTLDMTQEHKEPFISRYSSNKGAWLRTDKILESTIMNDGKDNKTHNVANLERMHGITDDMEIEEDTIDMAMTERFIFSQVLLFIYYTVM